VACSRPGLWLRFGFAGLLNTAFGYLAFILLELLGIWPGAALAGAALAGTAFNFQTSRRLVFRSDGHIIWFVAVYAVVLFLNWLALGELRRHGLSDFASQAFLILPMTALSFLGQNTLAFRRATQGR
jgi:putative flippase GtrA